MTPDAEIGVIGGSGLYGFEGIGAPIRKKLDTPFGSPSEAFLFGEIKGRRVVFLSRHGLGHRLNPSEVNYRANLFALKQIGVEKLISVAAVGSLAEALKPTDLVIPDQYMDFTYKREKTFFENGLVAHVSMADPVCPALIPLAETAARGLNLDTHIGGAYINIEGPQFSSRAESEMFRKLGFSIIGMTQAVEAKLARELEMCFLPLSFVTDYDCWHQEEENVSVELVIENLNRNAGNARALICEMIEKIPRVRDNCECSHSLENAIITRSDIIPAEVRDRLKPVVGKYL